MEKLETIEDNNEIVEDVGNLTKQSMALMLVVYGKTAMVQTS